MSIRYLLDTNVVSEPLRPVPNTQVLTRLRLHGSEICIASIVWHELLFGCYRLPSSARRTMIEHYLFQVIIPTLPIMMYDERAAAWHAPERARLAGLGRTPSFADGQIAAVAQTNQLVLVTFNTDDFIDYADLTIEDWRK